MNKAEREKKEKYRILHIALDLMNESGYDGLSIRTLCKEADISTGKFYYLFDNKANLLTFCFNDAIEKFEADVIQKAEWEAMDIKEQITKFYVWYLQYTIDNFGFDFVLHFYRNDNHILADGPGYSNAIISLTETLFQKAVQDGYVVRDGKTIREIASDICVVVKGCIFQWCVKSGSFDLPAYTEDMLTRCLRGLL